MDAEGQKSFRTLRGWLAGNEPEEETYFAYSATLRIFGDIPDHSKITNEMGLIPTRVQKKSERRGERSPPNKFDCWAYSPALSEAEPLENHINALWNAIKPKRNFLLELKRSLTVDVFLGYRSNCDHAGIEIPHTCLEMFVELQIPFGISIVVA